MKIKRLAVVFLCLCLLLTACGGSTAESESESAESYELPMDFSVSELRDTAFKFANLPDSVFTMLYEPLENANVQLAFGLCIPSGYDSDEQSSSDTTISYVIYDSETNTIFTTVTVQTAPPDIKSYYGVETEEEAINAMRSSFFTMQDRHDGIRKNIVEDFGYELVTDWTGTAYGLPAYYFEFRDPDTNTLSMRFYVCDDLINENFYAMQLAADVSADDADMIELTRSILFSLHVMDAPVDQTIVEGIGLVEE